MTFTLDPIAQAAYNTMLNTREHVLLLGKAGTGKSTLITKFIAETGSTKENAAGNRNIAVVAPTGVAAVNIGGQTIHSFFKFSATTTTEEAKLRAMWNKKQKLYHALQTLIIDEISMVRADLLDCIDVFLRTVRNSYLPFGGVQVIMVGDVLQLPPIVSGAEASFFNEHYASAYFFDAHVMQRPEFLVKTYELDTVYRQEDSDFVALLHRIRDNSANSTDIDTINTRVERVTTIAPGEIYLATTNARANQVNMTMLERLPGDTYHAFAQTKGKMAGEKASRAMYPTDEELLLKVGAQVMFVVNDPDKRFVNGTLGTICDITEYEYDDAPNDLEIDVRLGDDEIVTIEAHTWEMREARYDEESKALTSEVVGTFEQLPLRLAWACTIHKAQGKTFQQMIIDTGNGMFAPGQAYVALSRCTSLRGIKLIKPLTLRDIMIDEAVLTYTQQVVKQAAHGLIGDDGMSEPETIGATTPSAQDILAHLTTKARGLKATLPGSSTGSSGVHRVLVFDTETTGVDKRARIVQICCALYEKGSDGNWSCHTLLDELVNPGIKIPAETTAVHGISNAMVADAPTLGELWERIHTLFDLAHVHVAHNHAFDDRILAQEARRLKRPSLPTRDVYCTMLRGTDITKIPSDRGGYKWPKLADLYTFLWQRELDGYHDALVDVKAAAGCYFKMVGEEFDPLG